MDLGGSDGPAGLASDRLAEKEMMQRKKAVELTAQDESISDQGEPSLVRPDGAARIEGDGEKEDFTPATLKRKKDGFLTKVFVSAALALVLAMTGWMAYKKVSAPPPAPRVPGKGVEEQTAYYSAKLFEMRDALDEAWSAASDNVKRTFVKHYMPSSQHAHVPVDKALSYFKLHILEMSEVGAPSSDEEIYVKKQHLHKVLLVYSMVDAAVKRLVGLKHMEEDTRLPAMILDHKPRKAQGPKGTVAVGLFLNKLKERGIDYTPTVTVGPEQAVPLAKVNEFLDLLEMEEKLLKLDKEVHEAFETFVEGHRVNLKTLKLDDLRTVDDIMLPRDTVALDTRLLLRFLHARYNDRDLQNYRNQLLDALVAGWSEQKFNEALGAFKEHHKKHLEHQIRQKQETVDKATTEPPRLPLTHGFPVAIFLM